LTGLFGIIWGNNALSISVFGSSSEVNLFGGLVSPLQIVIVVLSIVVAVGLHFGFHRTRQGLACLALAEDKQAAQIRGINTRRLVLAGFIAGGGIACAVGVLIAPITYAYPDLADTLAIAGFVAVALGGNGHQLGGLAGGLVLGLVSAYSARYLGSNYTNLSILFVLLLTLLVSPTGIGRGVRLRNV
jgi:branched-chain amino acid transport system permease protein